MSGVYAYNPDYDLYETKVGTVIVDDKNLSFSTNLISSNASIEFS